MTIQPTGLGLVETIDDIEVGTLTGDVRDLLLQELRDGKNGLPWNERPELEQRDEIDRISRFADHIVRRAVRLVAECGCPAVPVQIEKWEVGKGLKLVATAPDHEDNITAMMHGGKIAFLVFSNIGEVSGERAPIKAAPDQPMLADADDQPVFDNTAAGAG